MDLNVQKVIKKQRKLVKITNFELQWTKQSRERLRKEGAGDENHVGATVATG